MNLKSKLNLGWIIFSYGVAMESLPEKKEQKYLKVSSRDDIDSKVSFFDMVRIYEYDEDESNSYEKAIEDNKETASRYKKGERKIKPKEEKEEEEEVQNKKPIEPNLINDDNSVEESDNNGSSSDMETQSDHNEDEVLEKSVNQCNDCFEEDTEALDRKINHYAKIFKQLATSKENPSFFVAEYGFEDDKETSSKYMKGQSKDMEKSDEEEKEEEKENH
jgi:hypothetical protein